MKPCILAVLVLTIGRLSLGAELHRPVQIPGGGKDSLKHA